MFLPVSAANYTVYVQWQGGKKWLYATEKQCICHNDIVWDMHTNKASNMVIISDQDLSGSLSWSRKE